MKLRPNQTYLRAFELANSLNLKFFVKYCRYFFNLTSIDIESDVNNVGDGGKCHALFEIASLPYSEQRQPMVGLVSQFQAAPAASY